MAERGACLARAFCSFQRFVGTEMTRFLSASAKVSRATLSDSTQMKSGMDEVLIPARSWNSVRTYLGLTTVTCTPLPCSSLANPSE